ncbi:MAG TPA: TIGR02281 family clan AA aspartic protease [Rhodocyclaceae bacterium]|nr:MAG: hypothetical protein AUK49_08875 [Betaproteobacteria bacterium CG2_30_68_42]PIV74858.1 MAG: TIGR02281 family clan AA aspartic protease [Rhodocyclales bacterium CG17_big_fil_post_rev_8_21_14_2_50_68_7]PJA57475.1 MAG: TIGR02281 family clan AA aspartic protease [Rhodocyclales bacterium CG_4_9_14_3_um_filter_68_10]HCX32807.1 TIGR02281 family clan AA aspartic protease [Rhodocyclaceae bacterium]
MATGFIPWVRIAAIAAAAPLWLTGASGASAAEVALVGLAAGRAVLSVDGGAPRMVPVGGSLAGVRVLGVQAESASVEVDGRRRTLRLGEQPLRTGEARTADAQTVRLGADRGGHYVSEGSVNGVPVRFMVDTGATFISLGRSDALRAGIELARGQAGISQTANGPARVWKVRLNTVRLGAITLNDVEAVVHATDLPVALLGMSFLNRMEMRRDGDAMTLRRRY